MKTRALIFALLLAAVSAAAQETPSMQRGFAADKVFDFGGIDAINTFNGNLTLNIPIGPRYPVAGGLKYGLQLTYNSKIWEYDELPSGIRAVPSRRSNAGLGWLVSMGRMISPRDRTHTLIDPLGWAYEAPDGSLHELGSPSSRTTDGTYILLTTLGSGQKQLEFPDGTIGVFDKKTGAMESLRDRQNNVITFTAWPSRTGTGCTRGETTSAVEIADNRSSRKTWVCYGTPPVRYPESIYSGQIVQIVMNAPANDTPNNQVTASYDFAYEPASESTIHRGCHSTVNNDRLERTVPLLTSVKLPDNTSYVFEYNDIQTSCQQGTLESVTMPTGAKIAYGYRNWSMPGPVCKPHGNWVTSVTGVGTRTVSGPHIETSTRTYLAEPTAIPGNEQIRCAEEFPQIQIPRPPEELKVSVSDSDGTVTEHYYSVSPRTEYDLGPTPRGFTHLEYGMPFTHNTKTGANLDLLLSTRVFAASDTARAVPLVEEYVKYESDCDAPSHPCGDGSLTNPPLVISDRNSRVKTKRVVHNVLEGSTLVAKRKVDTENADWDGLGHFRQETIKDALTNSTLRETFTAFNKPDDLVNSGRPNVNDTHTFPNNTAASQWVINTFSSVSTTESGRTVKTYVCFDPLTGAMRARRTVRGSSLLDVLEVFGYSTANGNLLTEQSSLTNSASKLCDLADAPP
ncbi:MAG TPA: hypothetical protein VJ276_11140, partial [Thermoanaerobaculia bacterium]|nr:hypothetical protein [Thermoanaerobaculia bacterium]